jgi:hypothetical protein
VLRCLHQQRAQVRVTFFADNRLKDGAKVEITVEAPPQAVVPAKS